METLPIEASSNVITTQTNTDEQIIGLWLHGRSEHTQRAYRQDVNRFFAFVPIPMGQVTLNHLQAFADSLEGADTTRARVLSSVKSLFSFAFRIGALRFNVGAPLRLPKVKNKLAERILTEEEVMRIITLEKNRRNQVMLRLLYASGGRVSEICGLSWKDAKARSKGQGQVTLFGKGGKTRVVLLQASTWETLQSLRGDSGQNDAIFQSQKGKGHMDPSQVLRIIKAAAVRAGIQGNVSPHWFRHSHASHSLDRGCSIQTVQATLGHSNVATTSKYLHARPNESSALYLPV